MSDSKSVAQALLTIVVDQAQFCWQVGCQELATKYRPDGDKSQTCDEHAGPDHVDRLSALAIRQLKAADLLDGPSIIAARGAYAGRMAVDIDHAAELLGLGKS